MGNNNWETIYARGEQLNRYPYSDFVSFFFRNARGLPAHASALDVGCGSGVHSVFLADQGMDVVAIDGSPSAIAAAQESYGRAEIDFQACYFEDFDPGNRKFDLVVDRLSTTHSTPTTTRDFYQNLKASLNPNARIFWQGFSWDNDGRNLGVEQPDGTWSEFSDGLFQQLGRTVFFRESDLDRVFEGYQRTNFILNTHLDKTTGKAHTIWTVELRYE